MDYSAISNAEFWLLWIGRAKLIAAFLVAIGVVIEFAGDWISEPFEKVISDARKQEVAQLEADAKGAESKIKDAEVRIAIAQNEAAQANLKTAELERKYGWRTIQPEQMHAFLTSIGNSNFDVVFQYFTSDPEAFEFADKLNNLLLLTKLSIKPHDTVPFAAPRGITLWGPETPERAKLAAAFTAAKIPFSFRQGGITAVDDPKALRVSVGGKLPPE